MLFHVEPRKTLQKCKLRGIAVIGVCVFVKLGLRPAPQDRSHRTSSLSRASRKVFSRLSSERRIWSARFM